MEKVKVVIYARVSTAGQDYDRQLVELQQYADRMNYIVIKGLTKKSPPKKKFSLSADMRELLCIFRLPNQCKYT